MSFSFGSINTGLPKDIVKQLVAAERTPIVKLEERKGKLGEKSKLVNELSDLMQQLSMELRNNANAKNFRELTVTTDNSIIDVVANKDIAEVGEWRFEVDQLSQRSSAMSSGFEDPNNSNVGVGYIQYFLPDGESKEIYVDSNDSSLNAIAKKINADGKCGMKANVINDGSGSDSPWRLMVTLNGTGDNNNADFPYFYFVDGEQDLYLDFEREAHDAVVKINGMEVELPNNKTSDLIPGLNIDLKRAKPGEEFSIKVEENIKAITEKVQLMLDKINAILNFIHKQNDLDEKTDTSKTLGGDLSLQTIESRVRNAIFTPLQTSDGPQRISDFGVAFQRDGLLKFDSKKFEAVMSRNYSSGSQYFTGYINAEDEIAEEGFIKKFSEVVESFTRVPDGALYLRKMGVRNNIDQLDRQIETKERNIEQKERILKDKFSRLESTMSKLRGQSSGLAGLGSGADPITQL